jgi:hypothetical protein
MGRNIGKALFGVDEKWIQGFPFKVLKLLGKLDVGMRKIQTTVIPLDCDDEDWIFLARN